MRAKQFGAPSVKQFLSYDALQRTAGIEAKSSSNQPLLERTYLYDKAGNIITRNTEEGEYTYGYDQLSRLKQVNPPQSVQQKGLPQESYAYDSVHNRVGSSHQAGAWEYNQDNQLVKFGAGVEETSYTYTANGHVATETKGGTTKTYTYDAADRLVRVTNTVAGTQTEITE